MQETAGLASSQSTGPSDVQHGRSRQVITPSCSPSSRPRRQPDLQASGVATSLQRCASAPQPAKLNPAPAAILSLAPRLARRFARSTLLHPYNKALLHRHMPPCFARVLLPSPPRFPFASQPRCALPDLNTPVFDSGLHLTTVDTPRPRTINRRNGLLYLLWPVLHEGRAPRTSHPNSFVSSLLVPSIIS